MRAPSMPRKEELHVNRGLSEPKCAPSQRFGSLSSRNFDQLVRAGATLTRVARAVKDADAAAAIEPELSDKPRNMATIRVDTFIDPRVVMFRDLSRPLGQAIRHLRTKWAAVPAQFRRAPDPRCARC